jgi:outer membrane receptor protein involved in Fe transport
VVVTAERRESTVSDTSISITAFTGEFLEEFGIRNQEDLQNYIPATVIEPYDMAIRGVGRNFRGLGGDPGIATYLNGVYSEDFGIASTEGGLFDVERIEVLRGPQGTLYGRNAIGGAINFINKLPTDEFEGEARTLLGNYDLREYYGVVSGPVIPDFMQARLVGTKRTRDGYFKDLSPADDAGNYGDENYALSLRFTPTDAVEINMRGNERSYRRRMGAALAAGLVTFGENNGKKFRDTETFVFGFRAVDPNVACPNQFTRTPLVPTTGVRGGLGCAIAGMPTQTFTNPTTGATVFAQRYVPGVDNAGNGAGLTDHPNRAFGADPRNLKVVGFDNISGDDLEVETSGQQDEFFDHQALSFDASWQVSDGFSMKYIFGYTDYFYDRTNEQDLTNNDFLDEQFYVSQETEYVSHELQFFFDPTESLSITSGIFAYDAKISQRGDFYDSLCKPQVANGGCNSKYASDPHPAIDVLGPKLDLFYARNAGKRNANGLPLPGNCFPGAFTFCFGGWDADLGDRIVHGPATAGTDIEYQSRSERSAYAAYTQGVYTINEHFAITLGGRWARDDLDGEENSFFYAEDIIVPLGFDPAGGISTLYLTNVALGYMAPDGTILDPGRVLLAGLPASHSLWRHLERSDDEFTWRVNLDWTPSDEHLIYLSATKGYRSGGFNLGNFSANAQFEPESLIAYELGYKGQILDGAMQINSALYFYDYEDIATAGQGPSLTNPNNVSTSTFAVPSAEMIGWDTDVLWLATEHITLGANFSYTHSEYTEDFFMIDGVDPRYPDSLFNAQDRPLNIEGNQMLHVPEMKGGAFGQYSMPMGFGGRAEFLVSWSWIDQVYFSAFENEDDSAPEYDRWDVRATWYSEDEAWTVAAFVNNVLDEVGIREVDIWFGEDTNYVQPGLTSDPRLYGLEVRYKFGAFR